VPLAVDYFLGYTMEKTTLGPMGKQMMRRIPIFDFEVLWHHLTWVYKLGTITLSFITIVAVTGEYRERTIRQNIIDGLSRNQFLLSKLYMVLSLALFVTVATFLIGLMTGLAWSRTQGLSAVMKNIHYLGYYFLYVFSFLLFSLTLAMVVKRSGAAIGILMFYLFLIEPIVTSILTYGMNMEWLSNLFPMNGTGNLLRNPFSRYLLREKQAELAQTALMVTTVYIGIYLTITSYLIRRRDI
ncbi:ABC transporter permease, partial [Myxococcota bacterium]|nr:ABC transporter permease [Myxococcota bacterium]